MGHAKSIQRGVMFSDMVTIFAIFIVVGFGGAAYNGYQQNRMEITAEDYSKLSELAKKSCSGSAHLKAKAKLGPILNKDYPDILLELNSRADSQAKLDARSAIVNETPVCS
jgi:hypothetical protein